MLDHIILELLTFLRISSSLQDADHSLTVIASIVVIFGVLKWYRERPRLDFEPRWRTNEATGQKELKLACIMCGRHGARIRSVRVVRASSLDCWHRNRFWRKVFKNAYERQLTRLSRELAWKGINEAAGHHFDPGDAKIFVEPLTPKLEGLAEAGRLAFRVVSTVGTYFIPVPKAESPPLQLGPDE